VLAMAHPKARLTTSLCDPQLISLYFLSCAVKHVPMLRVLGVTGQVPVLFVQPCRGGNAGCYDDIHIWCTGHGHDKLQGRLV
jgi:hypothetical protein